MFIKLLLAGENPAMFLKKLMNQNKISNPADNKQL